jgi:Mg2+-importing ATPase
MIPADCRIVQSKDLFVSESMLTGEALPEKNYLPIRNAAENHLLNFVIFVLWGPMLLVDRR